MSTKTFSILIPLILILVLGYQSVYIVDERERAVLLRFGELENPDIKPGIHLKIPFVNKVRRFDGRLLSLDSQPTEYLTAEKKALVVDSYVQWRIADVDKFYRATGGSEARAVRLMASRVDTGLRNQFGERTVFEVISGERDELIKELTAFTNEKSQKELGMEVVDIRVKKINLPESVSRSVFERMITERERLAKELRAEGSEKAEAIRAGADRQKTVIEADAFRQGQAIRGAGDAEAARIYAEAYSQDKGFYDFYRSLQAYRKTFSSKSDFMMLEPDGEFFRFLKNIEGE